MSIYLHPSHLLLPSPAASTSGSANFWFYAPSSNRLGLVETETSFPVDLVPSSHALLVDTFVEIERFVGIEADVGVDLDWDRPTSPLE